MTRTHLQVLLIGAIAAILVILALQLLTPGDTLDQEGPGGAHIVFSVDRGMVAAPGACVTVRWQVDHIQAVYVQRAASVGAGFQTVCVDEATMPVLNVEFTDQTAKDYRLNVGFLIFQPSTWLLASAIVLLALASVYLAFRRATAAPAEPSSRRTPRATLFFAGIGMVVTGLTITALVLELLVRFYFGQYGTRTEQDTYLLTRAEINARESSVVPLPFIGYGLSPTYVGHNTLGYRGDEIQVPKPEGVYRIVVLGDSSVYGTFVSVDQTFPYALQTVLRDDYGDKNVEVVNGGVPGYTSWNTFVALALRVTELDPDLVIVYEAGNDVLPREVPPECYSAATQYLGLDPRRELIAQPGELSLSALYRLIAANLGWMPSEDQSAMSFIYRGTGCPPPVRADYPDYVAANPPVYFERNVRNMVGVAQANHFAILLATWAYNPNDQDVEPYWRAAVSEHNAITERVARDSGALFFDYAAVAPTDKSQWSDYMHFTADGNLGQARTFAQFLTEQNVIPTG